MANEDVDLELGETNKGSNKLMLIIIAVVVLLAGGGGAMFFMKLGPFAEPELAEGVDQANQQAPAAATTTAPAPAASPSGPAIYHSMDDPMVINLSDEGKPKYLRVNIQFMMRDATVIEDLDLHMPIIRNDINALIGDKKSTEMKSAEDKDKLR
ncbi:MAG: flagellar basal body-associated FliL family protein, partial [bacterium]